MVNYLFNLHPYVILVRNSEKKQHYLIPDTEMENKTGAPEGACRLASSDL